ncbi:DUF5710 domain-containing protein [Chitinimonas naiadis]
MRTNLVVPFAEKDKAKKLGARWDPARKVWYVENVADLGAFAEWMPELAGAKAPAAKKPTTAVRSSAAKPPSDAETAVVIAVSCDCLPWLGCEKCQPTLKAIGWGKEG